MESLRQMGYTMLSMPSTEITPGLLLVKTSAGEVSNLNAGIEDLFEPVNRAAPAISDDISLPTAISGTETLDLNIGSNLSILKALTKIFSSNASAQFSFEKKKNIKFKLNNPKKNHVNIIKLDAFIQDAKVNNDAKSILQRLKNDDLYVITEVVKTKSFSVEDEADSKTSASAELPLKNIAEAKVDVAVVKDKARMIDYSGDEYQAIAIKAYQILYDKSSIFSDKPAGFRIRLADNITIVRGDEEYPARKLSDPVVDLSRR
jgi:hypothetical protein